jgi:hypothetical protein
MGFYASIKYGWGAPFLASFARNGWLQIFRLQSSMLGDPSQHFRPDLDAVVKSPNEIWKSEFLQNNVGGTFEGLRRPTDPQQSLINA